MESTSYVFPFRMVFFYLVTTGWNFYSRIQSITPAINPAINQSSNQSSNQAIKQSIKQSCPWYFVMILIVGNIVVVVVIFFTLTDRASTIPSNTRGCQSGTWSAGQKYCLYRKTDLLYIHK